MYEKIKLCIITFIIAFVIGTISTCIYTTGRTKELETRALQLTTKLVDYETGKADNEKRLAELGEQITSLNIENRNLRESIGTISIDSKELGTGLLDLSGKLENFGKGLSDNSKGIDGIYKRLSEIIESEEATNKSNSD